MPTSPVRRYLGRILKNIRRGDKANNPAVNKIHGLCGLDYYFKALEILKENQGSKETLELFVFSDDINWAMENFKPELKMQGFKTNYVGHNLDEKDAPLDLLLMYNCTHHIVCNSSFSWWGSYLSGSGETSGITIAPDFWAKGMDFDLKDVYPENWIILAT